MGSPQYPVAKRNAITLAPPSCTDQSVSEADLDNYIPKPNADGFILPVRQRVAPLPQHNYFHRQSQVVDLTLDSDDEVNDQDSTEYPPQQQGVELNAIAGEHVLRVHKTEQQEHQRASQDTKTRIMVETDGGRELVFLRDDDTRMCDVEDEEEDVEEDELIADMSSLGPEEDVFMNVVSNDDDDEEIDEMDEDEDMSIASQMSSITCQSQEMIDEEDELLSISSTPESPTVKIDEADYNQCQLIVPLSPKQKPREQVPHISQQENISQQQSDTSAIRESTSSTTAPAPAPEAPEAPAPAVPEVAPAPAPEAPEAPASVAAMSFDDSEGDFLEFKASSELSEFEESPLRPVALGSEQPSSIQSTSTAVLPALTQSKLKYNFLKTGYVYDVSMYYHQQLPRLFDHDDPHPESPQRIYVIYMELKRDGYLDCCERINSRYATMEEVLRVHTLGHYNMMKSLQNMGEEELAELTDDFDSLYLNSESFQSGLLSAGSVIEGCVAVVEGRVRNAFAIVRPPGHHAEQDEPMGFCLFNNVAIAIKYLRAHCPEVKRILVLDWDIHFGNGTQRLTNDDKDVLYVSLHRFESLNEKNQVVYFYPEDKLGSAEYCGSGTGIGRTVNIPWTGDGVHDGDYLYAFHQVVMPVAMEFEPSLVIVSAGFDAAAGDHIGQCCVTPAGYSQMTHMLKSLANGRLMLALEGGYNLDAIAKSAAACMSVLMGEPPMMPDITQPSEACVRTIKHVKQVQSAHWSCFK